MRFSFHTYTVFTLLLCVLCLGESAYTQTSPSQKSKPTTQKKAKSCGCPFDNFALDEAFYNEPLFTADEKPSFTGGETALKEYTQRLLQNPAKNADDSSKYYVFCLFVVEKDGLITHPKILHHSDSIFEQESLRLLSTMPKWVPGKINGSPARCWHSINLFFGYPAK
jgi:hypothetical protein